MINARMVDGLRSVEKNGIREESKKDGATFERAVYGAG